ncbi:hypothetical protein GBAR_LOCUS21788, partial [Geodia barretti]
FFNQVISVNFDPFYANEKELFHRARFRGIDVVTLPEYFYAKETFQYDQVGLLLPSLDKSMMKKISLIIVGQFTEQRMLSTVNLFLEQQKNRYAPACVLMHIRPTVIGHRRTNVTILYHLVSSHIRRLDHICLKIYTVVSTLARYCANF